MIVYNIDNYIYKLKKMPLLITWKVIDKMVKEYFKIDESQ